MCLCLCVCVCSQLFISKVRMPWHQQCWHLRCHKNKNSCSAKDCFRSSRRCIPIRLERSLECSWRLTTRSCFTCWNPTNPWRLRCRKTQMQINSNILIRPVPLTTLCTIQQFPVGRTSSALFIIIFILTSIIIWSLGRGSSGCAARSSGQRGGQWQHHSCNSWLNEFSSFARLQSSVKRLLVIISAALALTSY